MTSPVLSPRTFWEAVDARLRAGESVFVALVVAHTRHSPGTTGARMMATADGSAGGTIGGGIMERNVLERARAALAGETLAPAVETLRHRERGPGRKSGMICAGEQTNLYALLRPETEGATVRRIAEAFGRGADGVIVIGPEGLRFEERACAPGGERFTFERAGEAWRYEERLFNPRRLAILGDGHCGRALARLMRRLGFDVVVFDTRPGLPGRDDGEDRGAFVLLDDYRAAGERITAPERTPVVVMTTDFASDVRGLLGVAGGPFPFIGVMGSPAKIERITRALREASVPEAEIARIHAPVGLPIGSDTPEEIAVSVAAQLLRAWKTGFGSEKP
jgi:xanthine dehydrogenase accessory factor